MVQKTKNRNVRGRLKQTKPGTKRTRKRRLKVLIANETYPPHVNGAAVATRRLVQGLSQRGHQVRVVVPNNSYRDEEQYEPSSPGVKIHRIKSIPAKPFHQEFRLTLWAGIDSKLNRIFHQFKPDIVHIQNQLVTGHSCLKQARKFGVPVVGTNHFMAENLVHYFPKPLRHASLAFMWKHCIRIYNRLDCVIAPSYACMKLLREEGLKTPIEVISNGIDLERRHSEGPVPEEIYTKYGIAPDVPAFLSVGRIEKDKRTDLIIRATAAAARSSKIQTILVGKGRDEVEFRKLASRLKADMTIVFTGYVPEKDLDYIYKLSDVYIGAGAAELQGLAVMEAMAAGIPVLAANSVALPELVENGVNGFLFNPTVKGLADKMRLMIESRNRWKKMGKSSLAKIKNHEMPVILEQVEKLYLRLIAAGKPAGRTSLRREGR